MPTNNDTLQLGEILDQGHAQISPNSHQNVDTETYYCWVKY